MTFYSETKRDGNWPFLVLCPFALYPAFLLPVPSYNVCFTQIFPYLVLPPPTPFHPSRVLYSVKSLGVAFLSSFIYFNSSSNSDTSHALKLLFHVTPTTVVALFTPNRSCSPDHELWTTKENNYSTSPTLLQSEMSFSECHFPSKPVQHKPFEDCWYGNLLVPGSPLVMF